MFKEKLFIMKIIRRREIFPLKTITNTLSPILYLSRELKCYGLLILFYFGKKLLWIFKKIMWICILLAKPFLAFLFFTSYTVQIVCYLKVEGSRDSFLWILLERSLRSRKWFNLRISLKFCRVQKKKNII